MDTRGLVMSQFLRVSTIFACQHHFGNFAGDAMQKALVSEFGLKQLQ
jgi:hypothetical protein